MLFFVLFECYLSQISHPAWESNMQCALIRNEKKERSKESGMLVLAWTP